MNTLKVLSFNVQDLFLFLRQPFHADILGFSQQQWNEQRSSLKNNKSLKNALLLATVIKEIAPDVAMLCEVGGKESLDNFNQLFLHGAYEVFCPEGTSSRGIDLGFLVRPRPSFQFDLITPEQKGLGLSRLFPVLKMEVKNAPAIFMVGIHLKSKLNKNKKDFEGRSQRKKEIDTLVTLVQELSFEHGEHFLILGDFNDDLRHGTSHFELQELFEKLKCRDVLSLAGMPFEERITHFHFGPGARVSKSQLDGILASPAMQNLLVKEKCGVYRYPDQYGVPYQLNTFKDKLALPSDHFPIFAKFII